MIIFSKSIQAGLIPAAGKLNQTVALTCNDDGEQQSDFQTSKAKGKLCQTISPVKAMETRKFYGKARKLQKRAHCKPSRYADRKLMNVHFSSIFDVKICCLFNVLL